MRTNKLSTTLALAKQAFGKYKLQIGILTALGFLSGLLEGIGANALIPLFSFFTGEEGGNDFISQVLGNVFSTLTIPFELPYLLFFIVFLFFLKTIALLIFGYIQIKIKNDYEFDTREELYRKTLMAGWPTVMKQKLGHLETAIMINTRQATKLLGLLSIFIMAITGLLMYVLVAINISFTITALTLAIGTLIFFIFKPLIHRVRVLGHKTASMNKNVSHFVGESMLGLKTIKAMFLEQAFIERGVKRFKKLQTFQIKMGIFGIIISAFFQPISVVFIAGIFAFSYYATESFNFGALAALIYLIQRIFTHIQTLQANIHQISNTSPYLEQVLEHQNKMEISQEIEGKKLPFSFKSNVSFQNVSFSYLEDQEVLRDISFRVSKGEMIGLIGFSGAGKTTIFDLMLRLFKPTGGKIMLDNTPISDIGLKEWRKHVGYVSQDMFLTHDTVRNNIAFYDENITENAVEEAAQQANIYDFIKELPNGFDTVVGERGIRLSAGQRQRVAIARVLVRKTEILLLDEATSALDNESELAIQRAIMKLKGTTTILIIAHRLSTVEEADRLLVLEKGAITEEGSPDKLLKEKDSYFYKMYNIRK